MNDNLHNTEPVVEDFESYEDWVRAYVQWSIQETLKPQPSPIQETHEGPATSPSTNPWGSVTELILGPLRTGVEESNRRNPEKMPRIRRCVDGDVEALQRMLKHAGLEASINETATQDYPLSFVLEDECGEVRGGLFGSISYVATFLADPVAEKSRDPLEDYAALVNAVEAEMKYQGIQHASIWISVPAALRESASRLAEIGFERYGHQESTGLDTWVSTYVGGQNLAAGATE